MAAASATSGSVCCHDRGRRQPCRKVVRERRPRQDGALRSRTQDIVQNLTGQPAAVRIHPLAGPDQPEPGDRFQLCGDFGHCRNWYGHDNPVAALHAGLDILRDLDGIRNDATREGGLVQSSARQCLASGRVAAPPAHRMGLGYVKGERRAPCALPQNRNFHAGNGQWRTTLSWMSSHCCFSRCSLRYNAPKLMGTSCRPWKPAWLASCAIVELMYG